MVAVASVGATATLADADKTAAQQIIVVELNAVMRPLEHLVDDMRTLSGIKEQHGRLGACIELAS